MGARKMSQSQGTGRATAALGARHRRGAPAAADQTAWARPSQTWSGAPRQRAGANFNGLVRAASRSRSAWSHRFWGPPGAASLDRSCARELMIIIGTLMCNRRLACVFLYIYTQFNWLTSEVSGQRLAWLVWGSPSWRVGQKRLLLCQSLYI